MTDPTNDRQRQPNRCDKHTPAQPVASPISADCLSGDGDGARDATGRFAPGNPGGPGRLRGKPNAVNAVLKDDILTAYLERGGIAWLRGLSDKDFVRLLEKTMPREIAADVRTAASIEDRQARMTDEDRRKLAEIVLEAIQDELAAVRPAGELTRECG